MFKKFLAAVLAVAMIAAMWTVPVAAAEDSVLMNVDYNTQSREDLTGNFTYDPDSYTNGDEFEFDEEIGRYVNHFDGFGNDLYHGIGWAGYNCAGGVTFETLFRADTENDTGAAKNYSIFGEAQLSLWGLNCYMYDEGTNNFLEFRCWDGMTPNYGTPSSWKNYSDGEWHYVVLTVSNGTETMYVDGEAVQTVARSSNIIAQPLGGFNNIAVANGDFIGDIAFMKITEKAATAAEVKAASDEYLLGITPEPATPSPTPVPTPGPIVADNLTRVFNVDMRNGVSAANEAGMHAPLQGTAGVFAQADGIYYATKATLPSTNDYMYDGNYVSLEGAYTIEAYIYVDEATQNATIINGFDDSYGWNTLELADGHIRWKNGSQSITSTDVLTPGFHHVVAANDADGVSLYVDGILNKTKTVDIKNPGIWIIQFNNTDGNYGIALARFYQGKATDAQAAEMYTIVTGLEPVAPATPEPTEAPTPEPLTKTYTSSLVSSKNTDSIPYNSSFTLEAYANTTGLNDGYILYASAWQIEQDTTTGKISAWLWGYANENQIITSENAYPLNDNVHVVLTAENGTLKMYVNGVLDATLAIDFDPAAPGGFAANEFNLAKIMRLAWASSNPAFFSIYNKAATAEEVAAMYAPYAPVPTPVPLAVTYTMPEGVANTTDKMPIGESFSYEWYGRVAQPVGEVSILNMCLWQMEVSPDNRIYTWEFNSPSVGSGAVIDRDFAHVVLTIEGTEAKWYVNGALVTTEELTFQGNNPSNPAFAAGNGNFNFAHDVNAGLQIAKSQGTLNIYNRAATADEVAALYEAAPRPEPLAPTAAPIAADNLNLVFNVDARDGDVNNEAGLHAPLSKATGDLAVFNGVPYATYTTFNSASGNSYTYDGNYDALNGPEGYTIEAYVYYDASAKAYTFLTGFDDGNGWNTLATTTKKYIKWSDGVGNSIQSSALKAGLTHVVITSNPTDGSVMYINGVPNKTGNHVTETGIWILNFCKTNSDAYGVALARVYQGTATLEQAAEMYSIVTGEAAPAVTASDIVLEKPAKLTYNVGDEFDTTGLAVYAAGKKLGTTLYTVSGFDSETVGVKTISVKTIYGFTKTFSVKVVAEEFSGITLGAKPAKLQYLASEELDTTGLVVNANYYNPVTGEKRSEAVEDYTVSAIDPDAAGLQKITVSYNGASAQFTIRVDVATIRGTSLLSKPAKLVYNVGEELDTTGLTIRLLYTDGTSVDLEDTFDVVAPGTSAPGVYTAKVSLGGKLLSQFSYRVK